MKTKQFLSLLLFTLLLSLGSCKDDEDDSTTNDSSNIEANGKLNFDEDDVNDIIPSKVSDSSTVGVLINSLTAQLQAQTSNLIVSDGATKIVTISTSSNSCTGTAAYSQKYSWSFSSFTYNFLFGEDLNNYYWKNEWNNLAATSRQVNPDFETIAYQSKDEDEGCILYKLSGVDELKIDWSYASSTIITYSFYDNGSLDYTITLTVNSNQSGSIINTDGEDYYWNSSGEFITPA